MNENIDAYKMKHQINKYRVVASGCWEHKNKPSNQYGHVKLRHNLKGYYAHRLSYVLYKGPFDLTLNVLHACDNPICINPDHLYLGTKKENTKDMTTRHRGAGSHGTQLTEDEVAFIHYCIKKGYTDTKIASIAGIGKSTVHKYRKKLGA